jgi:hypothetical protein
MEDRRGRWLTLLQEQRDRRAAARLETAEERSAISNIKIGLPQQSAIDRLSPSVHHI